MPIKPRLRDKRDDPRRAALNRQRYRLTPQLALDLAKREEWRCATCNAPALEDSYYCLSCKLYWEDVRDYKFY